MSIDKEPLCIKTYSLLSNAMQSLLKTSQESAAILDALKKAIKDEVQERDDITNDIGERRKENALLKVDIARMRDELASLPSAPASNAPVEVCVRCMYVCVCV